MPIFMMMVGSAFIKLNSPKDWLALIVAIVDLWIVMNTGSENTEQFGVVNLL